MSNPSLSCVGKMKYPTPNAANETIRNIHARPHRKSYKAVGKMTAYKCRSCGQWHVGHNFNHDRGKV